MYLFIYFHLISSQSLNLGSRRGTTDDIATIPFHFSLSSAALRESPSHTPAHSSHLFFYLPLLLASLSPAAECLRQARGSCDLYFRYETIMLSSCILNFAANLRGSTATRIVIYFSLLLPRSRIDDKWLKLIFLQSTGKHVSPLTYLPE